MSWTYSGDPSASDLDKVRFLIGDTDTTHQLLSNEEINAILADFPNPYNAAVQLVRGLIAKFSRQEVKSKSVGDLSISWTSSIDGYKALLSSLLTQSALSGGIARPYAGGISISDKQTVETDTDRVKPAFAVGIHNYDKNRDEDADDE